MDVMPPHSDAKNAASICRKLACQRRLQAVRLGVGPAADIMLSDALWLDSLMRMFEAQARILNKDSHAGESFQCSDQSYGERFIQ
jgi:hypothetical protein